MQGLGVDEGRNTAAHMHLQNLLVYRNCECCVHLIKTKCSLELNAAAVADVSTHRPAV